jgi:hypothetical protein
MSVGILVMICSNEELVFRVLRLEVLTCRRPAVAGLS